MHTSDITIDDAWTVSQEHRAEFDKHIALYKIDAEWRVSPFWAYWFARFVIMDQWPIAESLIESDEQVKDSYRRYIAVLRSIRILGHTTRQTLTDRIKTKDAPPIDLDEHAERIASVIQDIKRKKRLNDSD